MKARFFCLRHQVYLDGYPLWVLLSDDPIDEFRVSFKSMNCPLEDNDCRNDWEMQVIVD